MQLNTEATLCQMGLVRDGSDLASLQPTTQKHQGHKHELGAEALPLSGISAVLCKGCLPGGQNHQQLKCVGVVAQQARSV